MNKTFKILIIVAITILFLWSTLLSYLYISNSSIGTILTSKNYKVKIYFTEKDTKPNYEGTGEIEGFGIFRHENVRKLPSDIDYLKKTIRNKKLKYEFINDSTLIISSFKTKTKAVSFCIEIKPYFNFRTEVYQYKPEN